MTLDEIKRAIEDRIKELEAIPVKELSVTGRHLRLPPESHEIVRLKHALQALSG